MRVHSERASATATSNQANPSVSAQRTARGSALHQIDRVDDDVGHEGQRSRNPGSRARIAAAAHAAGGTGTLVAGLASALARARQAGSLPSSNDGIPADVLRCERRMAEVAEGYCEMAQHIAGGMARLVVG